MYHPRVAAAIAATAFTLIAGARLADAREQTGPSADRSRSDRRAGKDGFVSADAEGVSGTGDRHDGTGDVRR